MTRPTQGLLMAFLGAVLIRLALTDDYLRYVTAVMKWPIALSGLLLIGLALGLVASAWRVEESHGEHNHGVPAVTWLLILPGLVIFLMSPPQLGSYLAERRSGQAQTVTKPDHLADLVATDVVALDVTEFIYRAQDELNTLEGQPVELAGFVSYDKKQNWYVTRMVIGCCAADAASYQVRVTDAEPPPRDQWVTVTGTYVTGSGSDGQQPPSISASTVANTPAPDQTYE